MSETKLATKADLKEMYDRMLPYLGGSADAGFTPVGTIISVMSNHAPANYLICDGTVYNIADYPELANHFLNEFGSKNHFGGDGTTTFAVPSLQGEFLRGTGTNSHANQGSGANVGEHQDSTALLDVTIANSKLYVRLINGESFASPFLNVDSLITGSGDTGVVNYSREGQVSNYPNCTLRPTNTSVLYCIATKNIYLNPSLDYSTDEKVVGTWIDSKPIYQKTLTVAMSGGTTEGILYWKQIDVSSLNIDCYVSMQAVLKGTNICMTIPSFEYVNGLGRAYFVFGWANNQINIHIHENNSTLLNNIKNSNAYITIQYTKTTS